MPDDDREDSPQQWESEYEEWARANEDADINRMLDEANDADE